MPNSTNLSNVILFCIWKTTRLLAVRSNQPQIMSQKSKYPSEKEKFDTAIESLLLIRIPSLCNTFTSTTLSKMIWFWICKDQNDSLHTAQHAEPLGGHIWSHFDWQFQSRIDQNLEFASGVQSKHLFCYNSPKSKNGRANLIYVGKDLSIHIKKIISDF